eukprot:jgi/Orpsp1_1/1189721/evm.model.d7180000073948.2
MLILINKVITIPIPLINIKHPYLLYLLYHQRNVKIIKFKHNINNNNNNNQILQQLHNTIKEQPLLIIVIQLIFKCQIFNNHLKIKPIVTILKKIQPILLTLIIQIPLLL